MPTVVTRKSKQSRMMNFYNKRTQHSLYYLCVAYNNTWVNKPPVPLETDTIKSNASTTIYGYQAPENVKFVDIIQNPTEADKTAANVIYYKDNYYRTTTDFNFALANGYTRILITFLLNKDEYIPVVDGDGNAIMYNQLGLYTEVNPNGLSDTFFITTQEFAQLPENQKGMLEIIDNRSIQSRSADQQEQILMMLTF